MNKVENILNELMVIDYDIKALHVVLRALEKHYEAEGIEELNALICLVKRQIETSSKQLSNSIKELDKYILQSE